MPEESVGQPPRAFQNHDILQDIFAPNPMFVVARGAGGPASGPEDETEETVEALSALYNRLTTERSEANRVYTRARNALIGGLDRGEPEGVLRADYEAAQRTYNSINENRNSVSRRLTGARAREAARIKAAKTKKYIPCLQRGPATPRFFIQYDSVREYLLRLQGTFITYDGSPVFVEDITGTRDIPHTMKLLDVDGENVVIDLRDEDEIPKLSSRTIQPGYYSIPWPGKVDFAAGYLYRQPVRIYRQGICGDNTKFKIPFYGDQSIGGYSAGELLKILHGKTTTPLTEEILKRISTFNRDGYNSAALSTNFAVGQCVDQPPKIYFRGLAVSAFNSDGKPLEDLREIIPDTLHDELTSINL